MVARPEGILAPNRAKILAAICTYKRNDLLMRLLNALLHCAERVRGSAALGIVLVDDTADGLARPVADHFADKFELGVAYRISGRQNISVARNLAIETAMALGDWTVITDDDCEPPPQWLEALLDLQHRTAADAITGGKVRRVPEGAPRWITDQPFLELGVEEYPDGSEMPTSATFNTLISSQWLRDHPEIRFDPKMGVVGGEDMVFFRAAKAAGLSIRFSHLGFTYENDSPERATLAYQLYVHFWHGNSSVLACIESGTRRWRMFVHGSASLVRACIRPIRRLVDGQTPQLRFCLAQILEAVGKILGSVGVRIDHR